MERRYYRDNPFWDEYAACFPAGYRTRPGVEPREVYRRWNGHDVHLDEYRNRDAAMKVVMLHGIGGNGRVLSFMAAPLYEAGCEVVVPDLPGYGLTVTAGNRYDYDTWVRLGVDLVEREASTDARPIILFGLSAGGMVAYQVACTACDVRGVAATCLLDFGESEVLRESAASPTVARVGTPLMTVLGAIAPRLMIPMRMVAKMRTLVNDETLLDLLMRDTTSAGSRVQLGFVASMIRARPRVEPEQFTRCPVLLVHPSQDRWVDVRLSRIFYDRLACPKRLVMVDGAGHLPCAMPGLRIMRDAVFEFARDVT